MAERRMFAKTIIDSDAFLDMSQSTQLLYFHLAMRADDDGFINNPKKISRMIGTSDDDAKLLIAKKFIIPFESGVVVIKHWKIHNYIRNDRYKETKYKEEKASLSLDENSAYRLGIPNDIPNGYQMDTQVRLGKDRLGKDRLNILSSDDDKTELPSKPKKEKPVKHKYGEFKHVLLTDGEYQKLMNEFSDYESKIRNLDEYIEMTGKTYKNHYLTIKKWARKEKDKKQKSDFAF